MKKSPLIKDIISFLILLVVTGVSSIVTIYLISGRKDLIEVPQVCGKDAVSALNILKKNGLLAETAYEKHPYIPKDYVIAQEPTPGKKLEVNQRVKITLSDGKPKLTTPEIRGKMLSSVRILLSQMGLREGFLTYIYSDEPKDTVISFHPERGELIRGERINLLISRGMEPEPFFMPDLIGKDIDEATATVKEMGCLLGTISPGSGTERRVVNQEPMPCIRTNKGIVVNLTVGAK
ncbi:MAG: PASTA domain-containing protein [bacterium]|nr:PASTA domain-containing protein [bacterium]